MTYKILNNSQSTRILSPSPSKLHLQSLLSIHLYSSLKKRSIQNVANNFTRRCTRNSSFPVFTPTSEMKRNRITAGLPVHHIVPESLAYVIGSALWDAVLWVCSHWFSFLRRWTAALRQRSWINELQLRPTENTSIAHLFKAASTALPARLHLWALYSLGAFPIIALSNESEPTRSQRDEKNVSEHFVITLKYKIIIRKFFLALWLAFHTTLLILEGWELVQESLEENSR